MSGSIDNIKFLKETLSNHEKMLTKNTLGYHPSALTKNIESTNFLKDLEKKYFVNNFDFDQFSQEINKDNKKSKKSRKKKNNKVIEQPLAFDKKWENISENEIDNELNQNINADITINNKND